MAITPREFIAILGRIAAAMEAQKDYFSELDRAIGDGDHGVSLSVGWAAVTEALAALPDEPDFAQVCMAASKAFLGSVGGSCGPLYATALMRGGMALKGKETLDRDAVVAFLIAAGGGIRDRGKAEPGDKTMLDTWHPAVAALEAANGNGADLSASLAACVSGAEAGMNGTKDLLAKKGRSSRLGERSRGHVDPGAASSYCFIKTFADGVLAPERG